MSIRKIAAVASGFLAVSSAVFAQQQPLVNSEGQVSQQALQRASQNGLYAGLAFGQIWSDWQDSANFASGSNKQGGSLFDFLVGYRYSSYLAGEMGYLYLPDVGGVMFANGQMRGRLKSYVVNFSLKLMQPIYSNLSAYAKVGLAYRSFTLEGSASYLRGIFAVGTEYTLNSNFSFAFQFNYLPGDGSLNSAEIRSVPATSMLTLGMDYNFST